MKNYKLLILWIIVFIFKNSFTQNEISIMQNQLKSERVIESIKDKENYLVELFQSKNIDFPPSNVLFRAFKAEALLEVWVFDFFEKKYTLLKEYDICKSSGNFGPKRKEGDFQVPEGFYYIDRFNNQSSFYLSLGLNYPNDSDLILSDKQKPGNDIFIHGNCVTVGCLPMTDDKIKEIYLIALQAKLNGQEKIPVHIFPFNFNMLNIFLYKNKHPEHIDFWNNLEEEYIYFDCNKNVRKYYVDEKGKYIFKN
jgi:murein L,D-transpeptidase YafK